MISAPTVRQQLSIAEIDLSQRDKAWGKYIFSWRYSRRQWPNAGLDSGQRFISATSYQYTCFCFRYCLHYVLGGPWTPGLQNFNEGRCQGHHKDFTETCGSSPGSPGTSRGSSSASLGSPRDPAGPTEGLEGAPSASQVLLKSAPYAEIQQSP